jgi:hypothetical protein
MFRKTIINAAFAAIRRFLIDRITFEPLKQAFQKLLNPASDVADILTDKNPNNREQLEQFWNEHKHELAADGLDVAVAIVKAKVKDPDVRDLIIGLLESIEPTSGLVKA